MMNKTLAMEIDWREYLIKKLMPTCNSLQVAARKEKEKNEARLSTLRGYNTAEEAQDAYGYGSITREEYEAILDRIETDKEAAATVTKNSAALEELSAFIARLQREVRDLRWETLPDAEKERIRTANSDYKEELNRRLIEVTT